MRQELQLAGQHWLQWQRWSTRSQSQPWPRSMGSCFSDRRVKILINGGVKELSGLNSAHGTFNGCTYWWERWGFRGAGVSLHPPPYIQTMQRTTERQTPEG